MNLAIFTLLIPAVILFAYAWRRGDGSHRRGLAQGGRTLLSVLPLLLLAFTTIGYVGVLLPQEGLQNLMGPDSGWRGLLRAQGMGMLMPGGPYVVLPLISTLYQLGTGLGATIALVTSWSSLSLFNALWEARFIGWRFTLIRWTLLLPFPLLVGLLAEALFGGTS